MSKEPSRLRKGTMSPLVTDQQDVNSTMPAQCESYSSKENYAQYNFTTKQSFQNAFWATLRRRGFFLVTEQKRGTHYWGICFNNTIYLPF